MAQKARYCLAAPKPTPREVYLKDLQVHLLRDSEGRSQLRKAFMNFYKGI